GNSGDPYFMTWDYVTIKYGPAGESLWLKRYNGPADSHDEVRAMAIDANGNVYVTGGSVGSGSSWDCTTIKYTPSGTEEWVRRYNGPANLADWGNAITVDGSGNIYVTGGSAVTGSDWDFITIKYNSAGVEQWVRRYNGPANDFDEAQAIATDGNNIYVTGKSTASNLHTDYVTIKYNTNGDSLWVKRYNGPANDDDNPLAITVDQSGYLYVTGESKGSGTEFDYATIKYPVTGIEDEYSKKSILFGESIQILPNPFRHSTTIQYQLSNPGYVSLKIYNAVGQMIQTLVNEHKGPGIHQTNFYPLRLTNGVYFAELDIYPDDRSTTKQSLKRKLLLIEE
ncbi:MAG: SBBP repeat-containing protein, partial [candidate division WOR-3 bacterium]